MKSSTRERREVSVRGIVQGVGFRPFRLRAGAQARARRCWSATTPKESVSRWKARRRSWIASCARWKRKPRRWPWSSPSNGGRSRLRGDSEFRIEESREGTRRHALVSPDVATCEDCLSELSDPADRRYRYPFTNCTNCGPRFTITRQVPVRPRDHHDGAFRDVSRLPARVRRSYANRRFHAQPNACPVCGPRVKLLDRFGHTSCRLNKRTLSGAAARMLRGRAIVAIKGLGGYHLACDPFDEQAVRTLRGRKVRQDKPFALMARDIEQVRELCRVTTEEEALLTSPQRPVVLLERREDSGVADEVAPRQKTLGVMLTYTPLHHLLLRDAGIPLVMTSGNNSDEPIAYKDEEAFEQLGEIADYFLVHDREVHMRTDDSVVRLVRSEEYPVRRSRGYVPAPLALAESFGRHTLACGGELKNTFCVAKDRHASHEPSHRGPGELRDAAFVP